MVLILKYSVKYEIFCTLHYRNIKFVSGFFCGVSHIFTSYDITVLILILLTYSMEQSPSWEANWFCS